MRCAPTMRLQQQQQPLMLSARNRSNGKAISRPVALAARESSTPILLCSRRRCLSVVAAAADPDDGSDPNKSALPSSFSLPSIPNPFRSRKKEEDAKNLLKGMFEGKGDPLSLYDNGGPGYKGKQGGGGGSGGGSGGGGGGGSSGDGSGDSSNGPLDQAKAFFEKLLASLGAKARGVLKVLLAVLAFGSLFVAIPLAKPAAATAVRAVNWAMRLDSANPRARLERQASRRREAILRAEAEAAMAAEAAAGERGGGEVSPSSSSSAASLAEAAGTRTAKGAPTSGLLLGASEVAALAKYGPDDLGDVVEAAAEAARRAAAEKLAARHQQQQVKKGR